MISLRTFSTLALALFLCDFAHADPTEAVAPTEESAPTEVVAHAELTAQKPPEGAMWVEDLNLSRAIVKRGDARAGRTWGNNKITLNGIIYPHGVGMPGESDIAIDLKGSALGFQAQVGVDDEVNINGRLSFSVIVDGRTVFDSGEMHGNDPSKFVQVNLTGAHILVLRVTDTDGSDRDDNPDWAGAMLQLVPGATATPSMQMLSPTVSFPTIRAANPKPEINGPSIVGFSPDKPFLYAIPATGEGTLAFAATGLPAGLKLDSKSGLIAGQVAAEGTYAVRLSVSNAKGKAEKTLTLRCAANALALTPPMGWNAFSVFGDTSSAAKVRGAAQWLVKSGLAEHGYRTVLLGDSWQGKRDEKGVLQPNSRFPDMKGLGDYLHSLGLQFGIHTAATERTTVGNPGSAGHEAQDAQLFASWGVDYLTCDWAPGKEDVAPIPSREDKDKLLPVMETNLSMLGEALQKTNRDIVFSISLPAPGYLEESRRIASAPLAKKVGAQVWDERNALYDDWKILSDVGPKQIKNAAPAPGFWTNSGPLLLGRLGYPDSHLSKLTPGEGMFQMSMWSLLSAPLILNGDLSRLDPNLLAPLTTAILTNDEVLDINQDPLGKAPTTLPAGVHRFIWAKPLVDGRLAVGLFNSSSQPLQMRIAWPDLGLSGAQPVRDVWAHQDRGAVKDTFETLVPAHGVVLLKVGSPTAKVTK